MALKSARIVDLCCKSSGFADFENTADGGSAVIFEADSGLCLSYVRTLGPKRNLDHKSFFSLDRHLNEFIQIISFFERSSFYLRCETVIGIDHFTVADLVTWPLNGSEAGVDLVLIHTSLLLLCKSSCSYANQLTFT